MAKRKLIYPPMMMTTMTTTIQFQCVWRTIYNNTYYSTNLRAIRRLISFSSIKLCTVKSLRDVIQYFGGAIRYIQRRRRRPGSPHAVLQLFFFFFFPGWRGDCGHARHAPITPPLTFVPYRFPSTKNKKIERNGDDSRQRRSIFNEHLHRWWKCSEIKWWLE